MADEALQGVEAGNALADSERKALAFNALAKVYGPMAGNPEAALQMQQYGFNEQDNPLKLQHQTLENTGLGLQNTGQEQENAFAAEADPLKIKALGLGNEKSAQEISQSAQSFPLEQQQRRAQIGLTGAQTANVGAETQTRKFELGQAEAGATRQAAMGLLATLSDDTAQGGDPGATFDKYAPTIAKFEGVSEDHLSGLRQMYVQDPKGTIDKLSSAIAASDMGMANGKGRSTGANGMTPLQQRAQTVNALQVTQQRTQAVPQAVDQAAALIPKMSGSAILRKARAEIPGTPEYQFEQAVHQIGSNLSLDDLRSLRSSGLSLGRVAVAEFQASQNAFANMDLGQDPTVLSGNLQRLKGTYGRINDNLSSDIKRLGFGIPGANTSAAKGAQTPNYTKGQVYRDAAGNTATWDGSKFVEGGK